MHAAMWRRYSTTHGGRVHLIRLRVLVYDVSSHGNS